MQNDELQTRFVRAKALRAGCSSFRIHHSALLLFSVVLFSCTPPGPQPEITPQVRFNKKSVSLGTPVEVTYSFTTTPRFSGVKKDYILFVRFRDPRGMIRFVDDHKPPVLSNQWQANQTYSYTRTVIIPEKIPEGTYSVELGMYQSSGRGERILLNAPKVGTRSYDMGQLQIVPAASEGEFVSGWYDAESDPHEDWYHWRWIGADAVLRVRNPQADSILYLKAATDLGRFPSPPKITVQVGSETVSEFELNTGEFLKTFSVSKGQLGVEKTVDLSIHIDQTFVPSSNGTSKDTRQLGLKVFLFYLGNAS